MNSIRFSILVIVSCLFFFSCASEGNSDNSSDKAKVISVVCSTSMLGDAVQNVIGTDKSFTVTSLMGAGVDPHLYKPTPGNIKSLQQADVIFYHGLYLEAKLEEVLKKMRGKPVKAVGDALAKSKLIILDEEGSSGKEKTVDPHVWHDIDNWKVVVKEIANTLSELAPTKAQNINANTTTYLKELDVLKANTLKTIAKLPKEQRVLVTSHDAFSYFGKSYGFEVRGLQGISTVSEFGLKDVTEMVNFLVERKIKSIFVETSVQTKALEAVQEGCQKKGWKIIVNGPLFSDAMGKGGTPEGTYIGMVNSNVSKIVNGLLIK